MKTQQLVSEVTIMNFESFLTWYLDSRKSALGENCLPSLEALKRDYIDYLMEMTDNDIEAVSDILRLPPKGLVKRLRKYNQWH